MPRHSACQAHHLTVHFKDKISLLLAKDVPFMCPKCRYVAMDWSSLIRHSATHNGLVDTYLKDWLERNNWKEEASALKCRLCEDFSAFSKKILFPLFSLRPY